MKGLLRIGLPCLFFIQLGFIGFAQSRIISTVAGNGSNGYSGDGNPAASAQLSYSTGIAVDTTGNPLIADSGNSRIWKVAEASFSDIFFPHVAIGGGWSTSFTLSNTGSTETHGNLVLTDFQGNPFTLSSSSLGIGSSFPISIPAGGTIFLTVNPVSPDDFPKSGWAKAEIWSGSLDGVAKYKFVSQGVAQNAAGVLSSQPTQYATIPVDDSDSLLRHTAY